MGGRKYFLDWLRVIAFALLIAFHVGALYASWHYNLKSPRPAHEVEWLLSLFAPWRMALLFLISGVASRYMIRKLGAGGFARDRLRRLLPVILFGMFVVIPPQTYVELVSKGVTDANYLDFWLFSYLRADQTLVAPLGKTMPTWDHLWFLVYLLAYTLALALILAFTSRGRDPGPSRVPLWLLLAAPPLLLVGANLVIEHWAPITHAFVNDWGGHLKWIGMFATGAVCASHAEFWGWLRRQRRIMLAVAAILFVLQTVNHAVWLTGRVDPVWDGVLYSLVTGLFSWAAICALCGYAGQFLDKPSPQLMHLNEAILPVYVLHQPILLIAAYYLFPLQLPLGLEAAALFAITILGAFALYETLIRPFDPARFLFGLKPRLREPAAGVAPA